MQVISQAFRKLYFRDINKTINYGIKVIRGSSV